MGSVGLRYHSSSCSAIDNCWRIFLPKFPNGNVGLRYGTPRQSQYECAYFQFEILPTWTNYLRLVINFIITFFYTFHLIRIESTSITNYLIEALIESRWTRFVNGLLKRILIQSSKYLLAIKHFLFYHEDDLVLANFLSNCS